LFLANVFEYFLESQNDYAIEPAFVLNDSPYLVP